MTFYVKMAFKILFMLTLFSFHIFFVFSEKDKATGLAVVHSDEDSDVTEEGGISINEVKDFSEDIYGEEFIPTSEWKTVKPGQAIPRGLHVRLNLETGLREAKLLDDGSKNEEVTDPKKGEKQATESGDRFDHGEGRLKQMKDAMEQAMKDLNQPEEKDIEYWQDGGKAGMVNLGKDHFTQDELKEALKKFKANSDDVQDKKIKENAARNQFRHIDEIKKEFEDINMAIKTDLEILQEIHQKYVAENVEVDDKLGLLEDLEFYVHQIDNAINFVDLGIMHLVLKDLNHTNEAVRAAAAFVIGSSVQSNPKVQIQAIEAGAMHQMIRMLSLETSATIQKRVMYAISALVRNFPYAQHKFLEQGGLQNLGNIFIQSNNEKLKIKIITLLGDLVHEHTSLQKEKHSQNEKEFKETLRQYNMIPLFEFILEHGWCDLIPSLLSLPDHDQREKTLVSMKELLPVCKTYDPSVLQQLQILKIEYTTLAEKEKKEKSDNLYFSTVADTVSFILNTHYIRDEL